MQEDNWSKRLAESLKKQQENNPLPYEEGAWEVFKKKKHPTESLPWFYWGVGIAASIAFGMLLVNFSQSPLSIPETGISLKEKVGGKNIEPHLDPESGKLNSESEQKESATAQGENKNYELLADTTYPPTQKQASQGKKEISSVTKSNSALFETVPMILPSSFSDSSDLMAFKQPSNNRTVSPEVSLLKNALIPMTEEEALSKIKAQIQEKSVEAKSSKKKSSSFFLDLGPGFWNTVQDNMFTSGSNLGLGLKYDLSLGNNLYFGSGLGLNFLNLTNQSRQNVLISGFSSPILESQQVQQFQIDVPVYLRFPLNSSKSISFQAGFSNLVTFNQEALQTVSFTRQVSVADAMNVFSGSSTLKTELLTQTSVIDLPNNRFFPLATANLGVNILVYKSQKTNFLIMPFYHYPLQDISGTGKNPALRGAALRMKFGAIKK